jgi:hypothetical protein
MTRTALVISVEVSVTAANRPIPNATSRSNPCSSPAIASAGATSFLAS